MKKSRQRIDAQGGKLHLASSTPIPAFGPQDQSREPAGASEWLSEQDFHRTLKLVDRTLGELKASEARTEELKLAFDKLAQDSEAEREAAQERVRSAERRAARAEAWAKHLEERAARAEARAVVAEEHADALDDWADRVQNAIEDMEIGRAHV